MKRHLYIHLLLLISGFCTGISAQNLNLPALSDKAVFSLITCTPGNELYNQFGHSAIRLKDPDLNLDFVYNFGTFNFDTPNFGAKFVQRKLMYSLSKSQYKPFERVYIIEKRGVAEQKLILDSAQRQKLFEFLEFNYQPQHREYLYDFFYDNCATRIRDVFGKGLGKLEIPDIKTKKRFRDFLDEYLGHDPWLNFGIDLILGIEADKICTFEFQMFLPDYLSSNLGESTLNGKKLMEETVWLLPKPEAKKSTLIFTPFLATLLLFVISALLVYLNKSRILAIWEVLIFVLTALAGIFLLFMWFGTDHIATQKNLNVLWANPLYLIWIFIAYRKNFTNFAKYTAFALIGFNVLALLMFIIPIQQYNIAILPLILMYSMLLLKRYMIQTKQLK